MAGKQRQPGRQLTQGQGRDPSPPLCPQSASMPNQSLPTPAAHAPAPAGGSSTPVLDAAGLACTPAQGGQGTTSRPAPPAAPGSPRGNNKATNPKAAPMVGKKMDASQASIGSILSALNNLPIGEVSAQLSIGVGANLGAVKLAGDIVFGGKITHDDDRRVRASLSVGFRVSGELDLKLWKASGSIAITFSDNYVFRSPQHFATWILSKLHAFQKKIERYVGTKAGASSGVQGKTLPALPQGVPTEPSLTQSKTDITVAGKIGPDKKSAFAKTGLLKGLEGSASYTSHTAWRKDPKTGRLQSLEGWVAKGRFAIPSNKYGTFEGEYGFTHNHANPDQDGAFIDWWFQPSTTAKPMRNKKSAAAVAAVIAGFTPGRATPLLATASLLSAKLGGAISAKVGEKTPLEAKPYGLHAQYNSDDNGVSVRYVRVEAQAGIDVQGEIPLGTTGLIGRLGFKAGVMASVLEVLGTKTTLYVQNVYNGLKKRAGGAAEWARWVAGRRDSLWEIFRAIAQPGSTASKEVSADVRAKAAQYSDHLGTSVVFPKAFDDMLKALTGHFDKIGNTAEGWKDYQDPSVKKAKPKPPPVKWAKTTVTGAAGGRATLRGETASDTVPSIRTLRDLHKQGWELQVELPGVASRVRGGPMTFKGRGAGMKKGFKDGLITTFAMDFQLGKLLPQLIPRDIASDPPRKIDNYDTAEYFVPMLDKILDSDASGLAYGTHD